MAYWDKLFPILFLVLCERALKTLVSPQQHSEAMVTIYRIDFRSGSEIVLMQFELCSGKSNWTGLFRSWTGHTVPDRYAPYLCLFDQRNLARLQEGDNEISFQRQSNEQPIHIRSRGFWKAIRYGTYYFWNRSVPGHSHKNRAGPVGSYVNRTPTHRVFETPR